MAHALDITESTVVDYTTSPTRAEVLGPRAEQAEHQVGDFLAELDCMRASERVSASRYTMNRWEYGIYAARFPDEVPTINGELERIAFNLE